MQRVMTENMWAKQQSPDSVAVRDHETHFQFYFHLQLVNRPKTCRKASLKKRKIEAVVNKQNWIYFVFFFGQNVRWRILSEFFGKHQHLFSFCEKFYRAKVEKTQNICCWWLVIQCDMVYSGLISEIYCSSGSYNPSLFDHANVFSTFSLTPVCGANNIHATFFNFLTPC